MLTTAVSCKQEYARSLAYLRSPCVEIRLPRNSTRLVRLFAGHFVTHLLSQPRGIISFIIRFKNRSPGNIERLDTLQLALLLSSYRTMASREPAPCSRQHNARKPLTSSRTACQSNIYNCGLAVLSNKQDSFSLSTLLSSAGRAQDCNCSTSNRYLEARGSIPRGETLLLPS